MAVVRKVLDELGASHAPTLVVFNKLDRVPEAERAGLRARLLAEWPGSVVASAVERRGLVALEEALAAFVRAHEVEIHVSLPLEASKTLAWLFEVAEVLERRYTDESIEIDLRARPEVVERLRGEGVRIRAAS